MEQGNVGILERVDRWFDKDVDRKLNALATLFFGYLLLVVVGAWIGIDIVETINNLGVLEYFQHVGFYLLLGASWSFLLSRVYPDSPVFAVFVYCFTFVALKFVLGPDIVGVSFMQVLGFGWYVVYGLCHWFLGFYTLYFLVDQK